MRPETEAFREYLTDSEKSESTVRSYCYAVERFFSEYGELTKENAASFKRSQIADMAPKTAANRVTALNAYCEYVSRRECRVRSVRIQRLASAENVITNDDFLKMAHGLLEDGNVRGYWMVVFLAKTGARASELVRLDKASLDSGVCEMWTKGKIRRIHIPDMLIRESKPYFRNVPGKLLFPNRWGSQMTTRGVADDIARWAVRYGIPRNVAHPHAFRHLYAIEFLAVNKDIELLRELLGHENINTTALYLEMSEEQKRAALNKAMEDMRIHTPQLRLARAVSDNINN